MQLSSLTTNPWGALLLALLLPLIFLLYLKKKRGDDSSGDLKTFVKNQHQLVEWSVDAVKASPTHTATFKAPFLPGVVITANPDNVEHIAKTRFANYPKGEYMASRIEDFLGRGIFNSDDDQWLWQRKAATHEFTKRSQRKFVVDTVRSEVAGRLLPLLDRASRDGQTLDMQHVLECFAFDNICHLAFGDDPASLGAEDGTSSSSSAHQATAADFMRAFDYVESAIMVRFQPPESMLWRVKRLLNMAPERQIREALDTVHGYVDRILKTYREAGGTETSRGDFLAHFAASGDRSDESLRDFVTNFLMAGRDTTSSALTWFLWLVSGRPDVEAKIVDEIRRVRGCHGDGAATFTFDELGKMHYVHATISESMRLYPPVPLGMHYPKEDDVLPDGTFVGRGWAVSHSSYAMGRLESLWGKDCEEFRPERWLREDGTFQPESPFRYPVFHAGPRTCLGKEMAYIQMKAIVACTFERFCFRYLGGEERPGLDFSITLRMKGGLPMQVTKRPVAEGSLGS
ncbi:unnamed protein product [Urochloa decumbens]|uniref:Cytochrome P450 n=1 Tax=Urochloa decumbens TaxID=240449 RepID=A0ABC8XW77_9POAL